MSTLCNQCALESKQSIGDLSNLLPTDDKSMHNEDDLTYAYCEKCGWVLVDQFGNQVSDSQWPLHPNKQLHSKILLREKMPLVLVSNEDAEAVYVDRPKQETENKPA